jgi:hypothetical protein
LHSFDFLCRRRLAQCEGAKQGDKIGRIFAYIWAIGAVFLKIIAKEAQSLVRRIPPEIVMYFFGQKIGWATFLANFFANSSGHPGAKPKIENGGARFECTTKSRHRCIECSVTRMFFFTK